MSHICKICNYSSTSKSSLRCHIKQKHTFLDCIYMECNLCEKMFVFEFDHCVFLIKKNNDKLYSI